MRILAFILFVTAVFGQQQQAAPEVNLFGDESFTVPTTSPTITRVEKAIQALNSKLNEIDELERQALISIDKDMSETPKYGRSVMDIMVQKERLNELKDVCRRAKEIRPRMLNKMREVLSILPKRERVRLVRRLDIRRLGFGTELDTA